MTKDEALQATRLVLFLMDNAKHTDPRVSEAFEVACRILSLAKRQRRTIVKRLNGQVTQVAADRVGEEVAAALKAIIDDDIVVNVYSDPRGATTFTIDGSKQHPALRHLEKNFFDNYTLAR